MNQIECANDRRQVIYIRPKKKLFDLELPLVWRYRELLYFFIWRDVKVRYKQAAIGAGWAIIQPLFAVLVFTVIFGQFAKMPSDGAPYPVFAFAALLPWTYFAEAFRRASTGLVDDAELIRKVYFPRLIIPLACVISPLLDMLLSFLFFLGVLAWYGMTPTWNLLFLPVFQVITMVLALTLALWLGPLNVRLRDVKHMLPFIIQLWMYASPIVYPLSIVPEKWRLLYSINPMVGVIEGFRWALLGHDNFHFVGTSIMDNPSLQAMGLSVTLVVLALLGGTIFFKKMEKSFADVI